MKTVYLFDEETGEFTTPYDAQESPLEPGEFITPISSTDIVPPTPNQGYAVCFVDGTWIQVLDNRGTWYTPVGIPVIVEGLLDEVDSTYTRDAPPPPPKTTFSSLEFLEKFTDDEQLAVVSATLVNPVVKLWYDKMLAAAYVDMNDSRTTAGLNALVASGLLSESRKNEILGSANV